MRLVSAAILAVASLSSSVLSTPIQFPLGNILDKVPLLGSTAQNVAELPLVETEELQSLINATNLEAKANTLLHLANASLGQYGHPTRVIGSAGHYATVNYLLRELNKLQKFYEISLQYFDALDFKIYDFSLLVDGVQPKSATAMGFTPSTHDIAHGPLVLVEGDGCSLEDFPKNITGAVALIKRGTCAFGVKSKLAGQSGAVAAVIYNNEPGSVSGTLGPPDGKQVATIGISQDDGDAYVKLLSSGKVLPATVYVKSAIEKSHTPNVIAQSRQGDQNNVVMLGGHSDSVQDGPGINDDGSGTLSLLEVAQQLTHFQLNNSVRFAWWSAEEEGLLGSEYYVRHLSPEENSKIRLFMDYDMMASPNFAYQVYNANNVNNPKGSEEIKNLYIDWYTAHGLNHTLIPFDGRSDYVAFIDNAIPGGGIAAGAEGVKTKKEVELFGGDAGEWYDHCYHQLCDDLTNVNYEAWEVNTKLIAHSVATYARSLENFPEREDVATFAAKPKSDFKYHGPSLIM